ncbi:MAG TPA: 4-hydroxy-tetrahydrodipicolinate reductase [Pyrinomonadaceae bacterium]|jgi:4-hydroxy-tetrahydrodipicolinate reductase|nr:4-hydroxy-tetrahydrodipicolinate reductase [Pyrinomonadaceae bacterium]
MKIALIGYGAMGQLIESLAKKAGDEILVTIDETDGALSAEALAEKIKGADVVIDFSAAEAVRRNIEACCLAGIPVVEGTTGWNAELETIRQLVADKNGALVFGANFSVGVNIFYRVVSAASELFAQFPEYEPFIEERHHSRKKDAPSGTALKIKALVEEKVSRDFSVSSTRAGNIPGTHTVGFDGPADQVTLTHTARSREGFASGALVAAKWIIGKRGVYEFTEVMNEILGK